MLFFLAIFVLGCLTAFLFSHYNVIVAAMATYLFSMIVFPPQVKIFLFSPATILSYFLFVSSLYYGFGRGAFYKEENKKILYVILIYLLVYILLLPLGIDMTISEQIPAFKLFVLGIFPYVFSLSLIKNSIQVERILKYIVIVSLFVFAYGIYSYLTNQNLYLMLVSIVYSSISGLEKMLEESRGGLEGRLSGTIGNPIFYAGMLLILFFQILALYINVSPKKRFWRYTILVSLLALFMNMFFTGSRGSLVALLLGFGVFCLKWWSKTRLAIAFTIVITSFIVGLNFPIFGKYQVYVDSIIYFWDDSKTDGEIKGSSVAMRLDQLDGLADVVGVKGAFFGLGTGWVRKYISENGIHPVLLGFESIFFSGVTQYGIIGFSLLYILLFIAMLHLTWHFYRQSKIKFNQFWLVSCYIFSYIIYAFMTGPFFWEFFLGGYVILLKYFLCKEKEKVLLVNLLKLKKMVLEEKEKNK
ncbi:MAG: hypothetical protein IJ916_12115 [Paludibacteraceae bacterium]|nr:hypothetical protein [Paludibacteraceae bacterium]